MNYFILKGFVSHKFCDEILKKATTTNVVPTPLNLKDKDEYSNTIYKSTRSKGLSYNYLTTINDNGIVEKLKYTTGLDFKDSINKICLPVFMYGQGEGIKAHRGVQKEKDNGEYQEYVAVCMLTNKNQYEGGTFYINPKATASTDGKTVTNDLEKDRIYLPTSKGDVIIFHNPSLIHAVTPVISGFRATCSWRTNQKQF